MKNVTFINAGAGSGKTYTLTTDLAKKLTQGNVDPSQVILTTFTELAAAEFREKARKEILNTNSAKAIDCATQLDNAFIGTVHSISYRFIRKYWYLLDYGADIQPMSNQNQDFYMSQSINSIVTDADRGVFRELRDRFNICVNGKPYHLFWLPELKKIVDKMEYYDIPSVGDSIRESQNVVKAIFKGRPVQDLFRDMETFVNRLPSYLASLKQEPKVLRYLDKINKITDGGSVSITSLDDIDTGEETLLVTVGKGNAKTNFYENTAQSAYDAALKAYDEYFISQDNIPVINRYIETIFNVAERWRNALSNYKKENHVISFDDMEKIFLMMLTDSKYKEVQDDVANNFRLLMVDEFQDSNPIQLKIFARISELIYPNGGESIWVGDPKQAIYGFRGSDSRLIKDILAKFTFDPNGNEVPRQGPDMLGTKQLTESWRSRPELVEFANKVFLPPFMNSGLLQKQIELTPHYTPVTDTMRTEKALYVWRTENKDKTLRTELLADKIKKLLEDIKSDTGKKQQAHHEECDKPTSDIDYRDVAVLCFSNSECNTVASALRKLGLPVSCEEENLMQCLEVYLLKTILLFIQNPSDSMLRAEIAMMLNDATTEDILNNRIKYVAANFDENNKGWDKWLDNATGNAVSNAWVAKIAKLKAMSERYERLSIYDVVVAVREELDLDNIARKWGDATQRQHNLSTVVNMAKAYDDMCQQMGLGSSILGFINYLTITKPENKSDNSANTIKVLTYHRSKGLEWPVVILDQLWKAEFGNSETIATSKFCDVNVCETPGQTDIDVLSRTHYINLFPSGIGNPSNVYAAKLKPLMQEAVEKQPLFKDLMDRDMEEALRLLYVGVTRAKDILVSLTSKAPTKDNPNKDLECAWPKSLGIGDGSASKPWGEGFNEVLVELQKSIIAQTSAPGLQYTQTLNVPAVNGADRLYLSPSTIKNFSNPFTNCENIGKADRRIIDMSIFRSGDSDAVKGSCIHNIFAAYNPNDLDYSVRAASQTLSNYGYPGALLEQRERIVLAVKWLYDFLTEKYGEATRIEKEYPILYKMDTEQILRGDIDLLWFYNDKDGNEKCVLIDYKTYPGSCENLPSHTEKYYAQLSAYESVLSSSEVNVADTLIYYPVQGWVMRLTK